MRKEIIGSSPSAAASQPEQAWLDLERLAVVHVSSEDASHPVESALKAQAGPGWRAATPGAHTLKLLFDSPQPIRRILVEFEEAETERTQEFTLSWLAASGEKREIVRQRWNFSPGGSMTETEDYRVDLDAVSMLDLTINPDVSGVSNAVVSLRRLRLA